MIVGFTGSRYGMSVRQRQAIRLYLEQHLWLIDFVVHGDCIGADAEFDAICIELGISRKLRPGFSIKDPTDTSTRAFCQAEIHCPAKGNFARNRDIANECDVLLATPYSDIQAGGTWHTIKCAKKIGKEIIIFER